MSLLNKNRHADHHAEGGSFEVFTVATLPDATTREGAIVYVSDAESAATGGSGSPFITGGSPVTEDTRGTLAFSNGVIWVDVTTGVQVTT